MTFGFRLKIPGCISSLFLAGILRMLIKATIDGWCDVEIKKHELLSSIHGHLESIESSPGFFHIPSNCTKKDSRDDFALKLPSWQHGSRKINRCKVLTSSKSAESVSQPHFWNLNFSTEVNCQIFQHDTWDSSGWLWRICQRQDAQQIVSKENLGSTTCHVELKKELAEESVTKKAVWEVASVNVVWEIQIWVASWIQVQHLQAWCSKYFFKSNISWQFGCIMMYLTDCNNMNKRWQKKFCCYCSTCQTLLVESTLEASWSAGFNMCFHNCLARIHEP